MSRPRFDQRFETFMRETEKSKPRPDFLALCALHNYPPGPPAEKEAGTAVTTSAEGEDQSMTFTSKQLRQILRGTPAEALNPALMQETAPIKVPARARPAKLWKLAGYRSSAEQRFAGELQPRKLAGEILDWKYEPRTLRLPGCKYTPDFAVPLAPKRVLMVEVKGWERYADVIRFKGAAELYPCWEWEMRVWVGGGWKVTRGSDGKKRRDGKQQQRKAGQ